MKPRDAAAHLMRHQDAGGNRCSTPDSDAVVSIILDGENAWETYEESRDASSCGASTSICSHDPQIEAVTVSEAIERHKPADVRTALDKIVPGSWINSNFNVWIGAPEDNRSWDYLNEAHEFTTPTPPKPSPNAQCWRTRNC
jgi:alpha-amylase/alpha-mannosidase (GH57 family)